MSFGIKLHNGHVIDFACAAGALAYDGEGWWFEKPFFWLGFIRPEEITIITKTLTYLPRKGKYRWYAPWQCIRPVGQGSMVNAVELSNPSYRWWIDKCYPYIQKKGYKVIVSIAPSNIEEAYHMIYDLNQLDDIVGIELNPFCPNVLHSRVFRSVVGSVTECARVSKHPLGLKLGYTEPYEEVCYQLDGVVAFFDLINRVPWETVFGKKKSPLSPYKLVGAVSGPEIKKYSQEALYRVKKMGLKTPVMNGGGIDSYEEAMKRIDELKADAITFGVIYNRKAWLPQKIIRQIRSSFTKK